MNAFSVYIQNGAFQLRGENGVVHPSQQELLDEMLAYPHGKHDNLLDSVAFGTAYLLAMREPGIR